LIISPGTGFKKYFKAPPTTWQIDMEPENHGLEDDFLFQLGGF